MQVKRFEIIWINGGITIIKLEKKIMMFLQAGSVLGRNIYFRIFCFGIYET